jgi:hypothetical protein
VWSGQRLKYSLLTHSSTTADHHPSGAPLKNRRAIQLGLKNVLSFANGEDILRIDDMTEFVAGCARNDTSALITPKYGRLHNALCVAHVHISSTVTLQGDHL